MGGVRKTRVATVLKNKMQKTVVVSVKRLVMHPKYKKYIVKSKKYMAHNEKENLEVGDKVLIKETRPLSKNKRWVVVKVLERANKEVVADDSDGNIS